MSRCAEEYYLSARERAAIRAEEARDRLKEAPKQAAARPHPGNEPPMAEQGECPVDAKTLEAWRDRCALLLATEIEWVDPDRGFLLCPFADKHTTKAGLRDTTLYLGRGYPHLFCLHATCKKELRKINLFLRLQLTGRTRPPEFESTPGSKASYGQAKWVEENRGLLLQAHRGKIRPLVDLQKTPAEFLQMVFSPEDYVWIGMPWMTGNVWKKHFRSVRKWIADPPREQWAFVCPNPLRPGSRDRTNENVAELKYLILESDKEPGENHPVSANDQRGDV
jgi:hypothetical protein